MGQAAVNTSLTFGEDAQDLWERLNALCDVTGMNRSEAIRRCLRAVLDEDEEQLQQIRRLMEVAEGSPRQALTLREFGGSGPPEGDPARVEGELPGIPVS